jgi:hypothetical protein
MNEQEQIQYNEQKAAEVNACWTGGCNITVKYNTETGEPVYFDVKITPQMTPHLTCGAKVYSVGTFLGTDYDIVSTFRGGTLTMESFTAIRSSSKLEKIGRMAEVIGQ